MRAAVLFVLLSSLGLSGAWAQNSPSKPTHPVAGKPKVQRVQSAKRTAKAQPAPAHTPPVAAVVAAAPLGEAELAIAQQVYVGDLPCELGQQVNLQTDAGNPGYFFLNVKKHRFHLRPVPTSTGAVRLEDPAGGAVWLQLANKSMLMNQKLGQRMADECMSPVQQAMAEHLKLNPAPHLLDVAQTPR